MFELSAKGAKYVSQGKLDQRRVTRGLKALLIDKRITRVVLHDTHVNEAAIRLMGLHDDYIDCLVVATGLHYSDAVVTEDSRIHGLMENESFKAIVDSVEPRFRILSMKEALK